MNIVKFERNEYTANDALDDCKTMGYEYVLVLGYDAEGNMLLNSSGMNIGECNLLMDLAKHYLLTDYYNDHQ